MKQLLLLLIPILMFAACSAAAPAEPPQAPPTLTQSIADECDGAEIQEPSNRTYSVADDALVDGVDYQAILCTDAGAILVDLYEDQTPITVNNFVFLACGDLKLCLPSCTVAMQQYAS